MNTFQDLYNKSKLFQILFGAFVVSLSNITIIYFDLMNINPKQQLNSALVWMTISLVISVIGPRVYWMGIGFAFHALLTGTTSNYETMQIASDQQAIFAALYLLIMIIALINSIEVKESATALHSTPATPAKTTDSDCTYCGTLSKDTSAIKCAQCGADLPKKRIPS
jgi:uncharacterized paraquat-inducible protein A